jgi:hypothetical protein
MNELAKIAVAIALTILLGLAVGPLLRRATSSIDLTVPSGIDKALWNKLTGESGVGSWIGFFERLLLLAGFWIPVYTIIGGWLAFKLAAKWEVWKDIHQVPATLKGTPEFEYFVARHQLGSLMFTRFLMGTLANILITLVSSYVGKNVFELCRAFAK